MLKESDILPALETLREKLKEENTFFLDICYEELTNILKTNKAASSFADKLTHYLSPFRENPTVFFNKGNIFERPTLSDDLKEAKKGESSVCCYKDTKKGKNSNNIRCIFIIEDEIICFLLAFVEKDKKDYRKALKNSVKRYNYIYEGEE